MRESQPVLDAKPPAAPDRAALRETLERKLEEQTRHDLGVWSRGICGPI